MRNFTRSAGLMVASVGTAAALALSTATSAGAANTALMVNGFGAGDLNFIEMAAILGGMFGGYHRENVSWPQQARPVTGPTSMLLGDSINVGADNLGTALTAAVNQLQPGEHVTIVGLSAGALVVDEELRRLVANPGTAPAQGQLNIVLAADSSRMLFNKNKHYALLNYTYSTPPPTKYNTTVVTAQYDGFADFPDRPNILAVVNAFAGAALEHVPTMLTDLSTVPSSDITVTTNTAGGVTTSYLVPAATLPLVRLIPGLKPQEAQLKAIIDKGYSRNDTKPAGTAAAAATPVSGATSVVRRLGGAAAKPAAAAAAHRAG